MRFSWHCSSERAEQCREARQAVLTRLRQKRLVQQHQKPGKRYGSRQTIAQKRPRVGGRFVKSARTITAEVDSQGDSAHVGPQTGGARKLSDDEPGLEPGPPTTYPHARCVCSSFPTPTCRLTRCNLPGLEALT